VFFLHLHTVVIEKATLSNAQRTREAYREKGIPEAAKSIEINGGIQPNPKN
jgi:hypothetical protein